MSNDSEAEADEAEETEEAVDEETPEDAAEEQEPAEEESSEEDEATEESGLQEGDFIRIDYTARTVDDDRLVDTTSAEIAEEEGIEEDHEFAPRTIVLGEGHVFPSVEDSMIGNEVGDTGTATVPADEAFGEYDEDQVRTISKDKIPEDDRYPGAQVRIDNQQGFVETIIGGRARVDFNHPLAGDDIEYEWEIIDTVDDREEQASGLLEMFLDLDLEIWFETETVEEERLVEDDDEDEDEDEDVEDAVDEETADDEDADESDEADAADEADADDEPEYETVEVEKETLYIEATPQLTMNQQWMMQKQQIGEQIMDLLGIDRIIVQEIIESGPAGMPGMMGGMPGMGGGGAGLEEALEEADIDADELAEELE